MAEVPLWYSSVQIVIFDMLRLSAIYAIIWYLLNFKVANIVEYTRKPVVLARSFISFSPFSSTTSTTSSTSSSWYALKKKQKKKKTKKKTTN